MQNKLSGLSFDMLLWIMYRVGLFQCNFYTDLQWDDWIRTLFNVVSIGFISISD